MKPTELPVRALLTVLSLFAALAAGELAAVAFPPVAGRFVGPAAVAAAALGLAVLLIRRIDKRPVSALGLAPDRAAVRGSVAGLVAVAVAVAVATGLAVVLGLTQPPPAEQRLSGTVVLVLLAQAFLLQGFPEELLFRGYLVQTAQGRLPRWGVMTLSVLLFTVLHLLSSSGAQSVAQRLLFLLIPAGFALIATVLRLATGSVWPAVAVHGGFHVSYFVAGVWVAPAPETYGTYLTVFGIVMLATGVIVAGAGHRAARPTESAERAAEEPEGQAIDAGNRSQTR